MWRTKLFQADCKSNNRLHEQHFIHQLSQILQQTEDDPPVVLVPLTHKDLRAPCRENYYFVLYYLTGPIMGLRLILLESSSTLTSSAGAQQTHRIFYDFQRMGEKHEDE
jgi:hypothetical protein